MFSFEDVWNAIKVTCGTPGQFDYDNSKANFSKIVKEHFKEKMKKRIYGVYLIRKKSRNGRIRKVIYIGKSGTIGKNGKFKNKNQNLQKRISQAPRRETNANKWFRNLLKSQGTLTIEYIITNRVFSPAFVEALLLQAYLDNKGKLPLENDEF